MTCQKLGVSIGIYKRRKHEKLQKSYFAWDFHSPAKMYSFLEWKPKVLIFQNQFTQCRKGKRYKSYIKPKWLAALSFSAHQNFCYVVKWNWEENYKRRISKCLFGKPQDGAWLIFFRKCKSFETWEPIVSCCTFQNLEKFKYKQLFCIRLKTESYQGFLAIYLLQCVSTK